MSSSQNSTIIPYKIDTGKINGNIMQMCIFKIFFSQSNTQKKKNPKENYFPLLYHNCIIHFCLPKLMDDLEF